MTTTKARTVQTRRIALRHSDDLPRHYVGGDLLMSHIVTNLSAMFPEGEDFFVRSVRHYRDDITDPELKRQVAGFIGQEAMHGREHRVLNDRLDDLGYPARIVDRTTKAALALGGRVLPPRTQLAITAALEHYTATIAEVLLRDERAQAMFTEDEIRSLLLWHAVEESEHKAVAFDVYEQVDGSHRHRALVMDAATVAFLGGLAVATAASLALDPATRDLRRLRRSLRRLRRSPFVTRAVGRRLRDYNRKGFHPDDHDVTELLERWRTELFGADGALAPHLRSA